MPGPVPCTPAGIEALLAHYEIPVAGREVCILGRGTTLGRPLALLLSQKRPTANAAVTVVHTGVPDWPEYTRRADIVVAAAGVPGILQPEHITPGRGRGRRRRALRGPQAAARRRRGAARRSRARSRRGSAASGPTTIAMLFRNAVEAAERNVRRRAPEPAGLRRRVSPCPTAAGPSPPTVVPALRRAGRADRRRAA